MTFVTGALEAQNLSQSIVVSLNRCYGYMDYTRAVLLGLKVLHASIFLFQVKRASCVCETESEGNN